MKLIFIFLISSSLVMAETIDAALQEATTTCDKLAKANKDDVQIVRIIIDCRSRISQLADSLELYAEPWNALFQQAIIDEIKNSIEECKRNIKHKKATSLTLPSAPSTPQGVLCPDSLHREQ